MKVTTPLYELSEQYQMLQEMAYDPEVDEEALKDTMEGLWGGMKADIEALKREEERLRLRRKSLENRSELLKGNLEANMRYIGKTKFKTALFSFNIQKNGGLQPLVIDGLIEDIPGKYLIAQEPVPDNKAIRELLKDRQVEWAHLEPQGESLRIR